MKNRTNTRVTMTEVSPAERSWTHEEPAWKASAKQLPTQFAPTDLSGPWDDEPDKVQWIDPETGLDCLAVRNHMGAWCGYVGVVEGHPAFEAGYDEVEEASVHGGLTFAGFCDEEAPEGFGICHRPFDGRSDRVWWLGFDCGHYNDLVPAMPTAGLHEGGTYRTLGYVKDECADLARQLKMVQPVTDEEVKEVFGQ